MPSPTEPVAFVRPVWSAASLGVVGDADPGRLQRHLLAAAARARVRPRAPAADPFAPGPGAWLAAVAARARGGADLHDAALRARRRRRPAAAQLRGAHARRRRMALADDRDPPRRRRPARRSTTHRDDLVAHGHALARNRASSRPGGSSRSSAAGVRRSRAAAAAAPDLCRQEIYDEFLAALRDARRSSRARSSSTTAGRREYGTAEPDPDAWPDLRGWIADAARRGSPGAAVVEGVGSRRAARRGVHHGCRGPRRRGGPGQPGLPRRASTRSSSACSDRTAWTPTASRSTSPSARRAGRRCGRAPDSDGVWGVAALHRLVAAHPPRVARRSSPMPSSSRTRCIRPSATSATWSAPTTCSSTTSTGAPVSVAAQLRARYEIVGDDPAAASGRHRPVADAQPRRVAGLRAGAGRLGVPALYYIERVRDDIERIERRRRHPAGAPRRDRGDVGRLPERRASDRQRDRARRVAHRRHLQRLRARRPGRALRRARCRRDRLRVGSRARPPRRARHPSHHGRAHDAPPPRPGPGPAARGRARRPDPRAARRGRAVRPGRGDVGAPPARQRLQPAPGPVLAARVGARSRDGARVPRPASAPACRFGSCRPRAHDRLGHLPAGAGRGAHRVHRRPDLRPRQGVVARRDAVVVHPERGPGDDRAERLLLAAEGLDRCSRRRTASRCANAEAALAAPASTDAALRRLPPVVSVGCPRPPRGPVRRAHAAPAAEPHVDLVLVRAAVRDRRGAAHRLRLRHDHRARPRSGAQRAPAVAGVAARAAAQLRGDEGSPSRCRRTTTTTTSPACRCCATWRAPSCGSPRTSHRRWPIRGARICPCQWYDPILADRVLPLEEPFTWNEYTITAYEQPGHTLYAVAYALDGRRRAGRLHRRPAGGPGRPRRAARHHELPVPQPVPPRRLLAQRGPVPAHRARAHGHRALGAPLGRPRLPRLPGRAGQAVDDIHERLLPLDELGIGPDGQAARIVPYRARAAVGERRRLPRVGAQPLLEAADARVALVLPPGWRSPQTRVHDTARARTRRRAWQVHRRPGDTRPAVPRIAIDVDHRRRCRLGQHAEALVDVETSATVGAGV